MLLITIANRAEAAEFIQRKHNLQVDFYFHGLYRSEKELLLLTGTDAEMIPERMIKVCEYYKNHVEGVVNLGIGGALDQQLEYNQIYGIRSVYHETSEQIFETFDTRSKIDCITAISEVLDRSYAERLSKFAQIVDLELYTIASVCHKYHLPFRAYKLISDRSDGAQTRDDLKANAATFSKHLFDFYSKLKLYDSVLTKT
jgi:hypothetical protein